MLLLSVKESAPNQISKDSSSPKKFYKDADFLELHNDLLSILPFRVASFLDDHLEQNRESTLNWITALRKFLMIDMGCNEHDKDLPEPIKYAYHWMKEKSIDEVEDINKRSNFQFSKAVKDWTKEEFERNKKQIIEANVHPSIETDLLAKLFEEKELEYLEYHVNATQIPWIGKLLSNANISETILDAYYRLHPYQPKNHESVPDYLGKLEHYNFPHSVEIHGSYPLKVCWESLQSRIRSNDKQDKKYTNEAVKRPLLEWAKGFKEAYTNFEDEKIKDKTSLFNDSSNYVQKVFDAATGENGIKGQFSERWKADEEYLFSGWYDDGKNAGYLYRAWYLIFENYKVFESLFRSKYITLKCDPKTKDDSNSKPEEHPSLTEKEIGLICFYTDNPVSKENQTIIAEEFKFKGKGLGIYQDYAYWSNRSNRLAISDPPSAKKDRNKVKCFEKVIEWLTEKGHTSLAKKAMEELKTYQTNINAR